MGACVSLNEPIWCVLISYKPVARYRRRTWLEDVAVDLATVYVHKAGSKLAEDDADF
jgi:hypothetical protein